MFEKINGFVTRQSDLALAIGVIAVISTMVIPLPREAMDFLIALNISLAVVVLLTSLYIKDAARLPSFPTILLLTTLFRLALNVSTTRLILLKADAGDIIFAFGDFVVQGNYVVGAVVFLILVLIQFVVIAKGSERVAEVAARFTLDAMQGKQMSIDADMRNQLITPEEARTRRRALDRESKLYGAMDGAMKFVKGDAIAGIIISVINIVGGFIIGMAQKGLTAGQAAEEYSLLTIGDGLVSQIPALLISVAAGLVVTRVAASENDDSHLASDLLGQFAAHRRALIIASLLLFTFAFTSEITGFPMLPFLVLGTLLAIVAASGFIKRRRAASAPEAASVTDDEEQEPALRPVLPLCIDVDAALEPLCIPEDEHRRTQINAQLGHIQRVMSDHFGLPLPAPRFRRGSTRVGRFGYVIHVHDAPVAGGTVSPDTFLALCTPEVAADKGIEVIPGMRPWDSGPACIAPKTAEPALKEAGIQYLSAHEVILQHLKYALRRHAAEFLNLQSTSDLLEQLRVTSRELVQAVTPAPLTLQQITETLRLLLEEQIPIRALPQILESMVRWGPACNGDLHELVEHVRRDICRVICDANASELRLVKYVSVSPEIESALIDRAQPGRSGPAAALFADEEEQIVKAISAGLKTASSLTGKPVIVTTSAARRLMRSLVVRYLPEVSIMSYDEISPEFRALPVGAIRIQPAEAA